MSLEIDTMCTLDQVLFNRAPDFVARVTCAILFGDYYFDGRDERILGDLTRYKPDKRFSKFCQKIVSEGTFTNQQIILALLYIAKLKAKHPKIEYGTEHQIFVCAVMLSTKFLLDVEYSNSAYAEVLEIPVAQFNSMEKEFLEYLNYRLYVSSDEYHEWVHILNDFMTDDQYICPHLNPLPTAYIEVDQQRTMTSFHRGNKLKRPSKKAFENEIEVSSSKKQKIYCFPYYHLMSLSYITFYYQFTAQYFNVATI